MKTFSQYIVEANPDVDKQHRSMAEKAYNKFVAKIKALASDKNSNITYQNFIVPKSDTGRATIGVNLGRIIGDNTVWNLDIRFTSLSNVFGGIFTPAHNSNPAVIEIARLDPSLIKKIKPTPHPENYKIIWKSIASYGEMIKDVFVHEFIHFLDSKRYRSSRFAYRGTSQLLGADYFNDPKELNAHTQEMISNVDFWFKNYYVSSINAIKTKLIKDFNNYKSGNKFDDAEFVLHKIVSNYDVVVKYLNDNKYAMDSLMEKLPSSKTAFMKNLTSENKKKVLARLYQYYDANLKKRFSLLKSSLESVLKNLNNPDAMEALKTNNIELYNSIKAIKVK
jgi:hypothetical protein